MNKQKNIKSNHFLFLAITFCSIAAFNINAYSLFSDLGIGARAPGMGNAFVSIANDVNSVYYNPAGLSNISRTEIMASHGILYRGLSDGSDLGLSNIAFVTPTPLGTIGFLWNQFKLSGFYGERTTQFAYGYKFPQNGKFKKLSMGASLKYLNHSFTRTDEAYNAMNGISATNDIDPVLMGENSKSAFDADIGILYEFTKKYTLGITMKNILRADMAFSSDEDKLPMKTRIGIAHKTLWMILAAQANIEEGPSGEMDKDFTLAAERIFPSLNKGDIAIRSSFAVGDRDFKQITAGLSYTINKIGFDYGFSIPLGTIKETGGNHKLAMTYHFGGPTVEEQYALEVLEQYKKLKEKNDYTSTRNVADINDPRLKDIKRAIGKRDYAKANALLMEKAKDLLPNTEILNLSKRLNLISSFYPAIEIGRYSEEWEILLSRGIENLIRGKDNKAIKEINIAQSLNQNNTGLENFLTKTEEITHIRAERVPSDFNRGYVEYKFYESELLYGQKKYEDTVRKLNQILDYNPKNTAAIKKIGSCHYLMENFALALYYWENALRLETNAKERAKLLKIVNQTKKKIVNWKIGDGINEEKSASKTLDKKSKNAREIERLYQLGADLYLKADHGKAADIFRKILNMDPENGRAKKALERILRLR